jgi:2-polyprenyl-6-methoxyphenol hydroxylase-like FAD-dependent oxidoreductase
MLRPLALARRASCVTSGVRHASTMAEIHLPALIVGGGPVGLYASALLSAYGVPSLLCERSVSTASHPRAHLINTRSMELLRELGVERAIREQTPPLDDWRHFRYCSSLLGAQIAEEDHMDSPAWGALSEASVCPMAHLSQPKLESILRESAEQRALESGGHLLFGYELAHFEQLSRGVRARLQRTTSGAESRVVSADAALKCLPDELDITADHLLACDGAHSKVRRALGLRLRGPPPLQYFKSVRAHVSPPFSRRPRSAPCAARQLTIAPPCPLRYLSASGPL